MGLNESVFAGLTGAELDQMSDRLHRAVIRMYDTAGAIQSQMSQQATWTPAYRELDARARVLLAAGSEQSQLFSEVSGIIRARREQAEYARRLAAEIMADWPEDTRHLREAELNEDGK